VDEIAEWTRAQQRVIALVTGLPADRAATTVPACPDWTVRDLLSHMVGLGADVVAGDEPDDHHAAWTARQVEAGPVPPITFVGESWSWCSAGDPADAAVVGTFPTAFAIGTR
jgi:hypothetical protein